MKAGASKFLVSICISRKGVWNVVDHLSDWDATGYPWPPSKKGEEEAVGNSLKGALSQMNEFMWKDKCWKGEGYGREGALGESCG
jgi:hypothetical protein